MTKATLTLTEKLRINTRLDVYKAVDALTDAFFKKVLPMKAILTVPDDESVRLTLDRCRERFPYEYFRTRPNADHPYSYTDILLCGAPDVYFWQKKGKDGPMYIAARARQWDILSDIVLSIDANKIHSSIILDHGQDLDPEVTLDLLSRRFPGDKFRYSKIRGQRYFSLDK